MLFINRGISRVDQTKNEFIALASHQLRTPLTLTRWYIEKLLRAEPENTKQRHYAEVIQKSNYRMIELVESLLKMSRVELGTFVLNIQEVDPLAAVRAVVAEQDFQIKSKKLQLIEDFDPQTKPLFIDPDALKLILQNLLSNAVRYTPPGGVIRISVSPQKSSVLFKVADTGQGIPDSEHQKVFSKLYRTERARDTSAGSGLGLYFVKLIVEQSKGKLYFHSRVNKGTTFYVSLPSNVTKAP
jgi:signal transduction histidine kinase